MWGNDFAEVRSMYDDFPVREFPSHGIEAMLTGISAGDAPREPFRGWRKKPWVPSWLWRMVAEISVHDAMILAIENAERVMVDRLAGDPR